MQVKYRQAIHSIACLAVLQADPGDPDTIHYRVMEMDARKLLDKNSETAQFDLELRIEGLKATAEFLQRRVEGADSLVVLQTDSADPCMQQNEPVEKSAGETGEENLETATWEVASPVDGVKVAAALLPRPAAIEDRMVILPAPRRRRYNLMGIPGRRLIDKKKASPQFDRGLQRKRFKARDHFCEPGWPVPG
jgi:hypothetical protein